MNHVERAAQVIGAYDRACALDPDNGEPATPMAIAQALADAGCLTETILGTIEEGPATEWQAIPMAEWLLDADVLEAADQWYDHACAATRTGHTTVDTLIAAVRARREANQ